MEQIQSYHQMSFVTTFPSPWVEVFTEGVPVEGAPPRIQEARCQV